MTTQKRNSDMVDILSPDLQARNEPNFAIANAVSTILMLPELRGFWPFSSINESGNALDLSGQGRTLTNNGAAPRSAAGLVPYASFNGTTQYYSRADEAGLDITGALTIYSWLYYNAAVGAVIEHGIGKRGAVGALAYYLRRMPTGRINFGVSVDGTASTEVDSGAVVPSTTWMFGAGRFIPSTELALFVNSDKFVNVAAIPAAIFNTGAAFGIGAYSGGAQFMPGRVGFSVLCAAAHSDTIIKNVFEQTRAAFGV